MDNADFVLYVSADGTGKCSTSDNLIAFAGHCQLEAALDRCHMNTLYYLLHVNHS